MTTAPASATPIVSQVRGATRSPSSVQPSSPATNGPVLMRISVLATDVRDSAKMKHVEAVAMHTAAIRTGPPPSRHCATMLRRLAIRSTRVRNSDAKRPRHRLVVHGPVVTRRAISPPLLQHTAAQATSRPPRRAASGLKVTHRRRQGLELGAPGRGRNDRTHDELGKAQGDEALHQRSQRGQSYRRELERAGTPRRHRARGGRVDGRAGVADAHAEVLAADRASGPGRRLFDYAAVEGRLVWLAH